MVTKRIIGIDFGTSTSFIKVKRYIDGKPFGGDQYETKAVVFDGKGSIAVPTVVQRIGENFQFGYDAESIKPGGTIFSNFKVDLESTEAEKQTLAKEMTQKFFQYIYEKYSEQRQFFGDLSDEESTLVSYPAKWREETRRFMIEAAENAGFCNVTGLDEASAAVNAVMIQEAPSLQQKGYLHAGVPATLLLIDMGAGTTDMAVCRYTIGETPKNEILATWPADGGNILFGGRELDELFCEMLTDQLRLSGMMELVIANLKKVRMGEIKAWKEYTVSDRLNRDERVEFCSVLEGLYMFYDGTPSPFPVLDRKSFEDMAQAYLKQYVQLVNGCIEHAEGIEPSFQGGKIDLVILTGGHSQWYFAKDVLTGGLKNLGEVNLPNLRDNGNRVLRMVRPQETVSLGLAYSAMLPQIIPNVNNEAASKRNETTNKQDSFFDNEVYGNTCANLSNGGHVAQQGEWIYYQITTGYNRCLYKIHPDGTEKTKLGSEIESRLFPIKWINVVGDWVYCCKAGEIFKIRTDGSEEIKIVEKYVDGFIVDGDWIYYKCKYKLYIIRVDGTKKKKLADDICGQLHFSSGWIYYKNASDDRIYKVRTDGTEKKKITEDKASCIIVSGDWIYFRNQSDNNALYKIQKDGKEKMKICNDEVACINIFDDWIFYKNFSDQSLLYKIRTNGMDREKVIDEKVGFWINVVGDWIYFDTKYDNKLYTIYRVHPDGTCQEIFDKNKEAYKTIQF